MTVAEHLAVPYILVMESVELPDGSWVRRAAYPELPGCVAEADSPIDAIDQLEDERVRYILQRLEEGKPVPVPRPPLRSHSMALDQARLGFGKWLVDQGRLTDGN